jgi:L-aminopeptidase/D-esterase-like protein
MFDGDTIFVLATGQIDPPKRKRASGPREVEALSRIGSTAADVLSRAIIHAMLVATTAGSITCYRDRYPHAFL